MSSDAPAAAAAAVTWPVLSLFERRVLGVLVEKAKTTPDAYPMSVNALVTGSNQKTNRDPILNLAEDLVESTLAALQQKGLAIKITGGRVVRWRHNLYENWHLGKVELAIIGELLLRGAQTEGELRGRASRMEPIDDLDVLRALLQPMAERGLVVFLSTPGRRGTMLTHGFHSPEELKYEQSTHHAEAAEASTPHVSTPPSASSAAAPPASVGRQVDDTVDVARELGAAKQQIEELRKVCSDLAAQVSRLSDEVHALRAASLSGGAPPL